jgi:hypothetical protein
MCTSKKFQGCLKSNIVIMSMAQNIKRFSASLNITQYCEQFHISMQDNWISCAEFGHVQIKSLCFRNGEWNNNLYND